MGAVFDSAVAVKWWTSGRTQERVEGILLEDTRVRNCPLCGSHDRELLLDLEAGQFCEVNSTYRVDFREVLGLPADARFPVDRCRSCGFVFARLLPSPAFLSKIYEQVIRQEATVDRVENVVDHGRRLRYLAELLPLATDQPLRILDYGCGLGVTVRLLRACGIEAYGYDVSPSRRAYASSRSGVLYDWNAIAAASPYDAFIFDNVLEHFADPVSVVEQLGHLATPSCLAYVSVPDYGRVRLTSQIRAFRTGQPLDMTLNPWEHLNYFSLRHLETLMARANFKPIRASDRSGWSVNVGLRPNTAAARRIRNAAGSILRLARYVVSGRALESPEGAFFRRT